MAQNKLPCDTHFSLDEHNRLHRVTYIPKNKNYVILADIFPPVGPEPRSTRRVKLTTFQSRTPIIINGRPIIVKNPKNLLTILNKRSKT